MDMNPEVAMVVNAAKFFPRIARGHGSRRPRICFPPVCNAAGCVRLVKKHKDDPGILKYSREHFQDPAKAALLRYKEMGFEFSPDALYELQELFGGKLPTTVN